MNDVFFKELNIPLPTIQLPIQKGNQNQQSAAIILAFDEYLSTHPTDVVIVVGDVTSTMACSIVAKKHHKYLIHIESGLRSFDRKMPEEINRILTDSITDLFFSTSLKASEQLIKEGVDSKNIHFVGNIMIDTLVAQSKRFKKPALFETLSIHTKDYFVLTLHRAETVDISEKLIELLSIIDTEIKNKKVLFPIHPRTKKILENTTQTFKNILFIEPLGYHEFMYCIQHALAVITDSGGIQEETTYLNIPCITYRTTTERPETVEIGSNVLAKSIEELKSNLQLCLQGKWKNSEVPELWDGNTSDRIYKVLQSINI
jgi:UDP-N-acetylglucosamine 2-epimerase (non-hydrolysing)